MKNVAIVDDHPILAFAISDALTRNEIAQATTINPSDPDAEQQLTALAPDLCLLDLDLGEEQAAGMRFVRAAISARLPVVMLTGSTDDVALGRCIEAGADGVIQKMQPFADVIDSVHRALRGDKCSSDTQLLQWVLAAQRHDTERQRLLKPFSSLTNRESTVLQHLIEGSRVDEIAAVEYVAVATVRSQVRSILQKLEVQSQLAAVAIARRASWTFDAKAG